MTDPKMKNTKNRKRAVLLLLATLIVVGSLVVISRIPYCGNHLSEAELLAEAQQQFLEHDLYVGTLQSLGLSLTELEERIRGGETICFRDMSEAAPEGMISISCSVKAAHGRLKGVQYYMTPCGGVRDKFRFNETT